MRHYILILAGIFCVQIAFAADQETWRPLFNGKDLSGWQTYLGKPYKTWEVPGLKRDTNGVYLEAIGTNSDPLKVFTVETVDGAPAIHVSGQGFGTITTSETFTNYHLRLQVKWGEQRWATRVKSRRDAGLLYFVHGEPGYRSGNWPRSLEFQIQEEDFGDLYAVATQVTVPAHPEIQGTNNRTYYHYDPKGTMTLFVENPPIGNRCIRAVNAEKPRGEWNTLDLICFNGNSIHIVNGQLEMRLYNAERLDGPVPATLTSGAISLQTEGAEVYYRNVEIEPITEVPKEWAEK